MTRLLIIFFLVFYLVPLSAQEKAHCYMEAQTDAIFFKNYLNLLPKLSKNSLFRSDPLIFTIPVVVHVVHFPGQNIGEEQNLSEEQIFEQLEITNQDFRRKNSDANLTPIPFLGAAADVGIEFCLSTRDPQGNPSTGILRHEYTNPILDIEQIELNIKNNFYWDTERYLNIWTLAIPPDSDGLPILGYASLPSPQIVGSPQDGLVIDYRYFGVNPPFSEGRTLSHELGHYFGLMHPWGQGSCFSDDGILDTPLSEAPNYACVSEAYSCESFDMSSNFMEYTDDECMNLFTKGQANVMRSFLNGQAEIQGLKSRKSLLENANISCAENLADLACSSLNAQDFQMGFEETELHSYWKSENLNEDINQSNLPNTWYVSNVSNQQWGPRTGESFGLYFWNDTGLYPADDWFYSSCLSLLGGKSYTLSYWYATGADPNNSFREKLETALFRGPSIDSLQFYIQDLGSIHSPFPNYQEVRASFTLAEDGDYHLGFHAYSEADQFALLLDDVHLIAEENEQVFSVYVQPSLSTGPLEIILHREQINLTDSWLRVFDMQGRLVLENPIPPLNFQRLSYDFSGYANGLYLIQILSGEQRFTSRFMKID